MTENETFVIVGAGLAGGRAAESLRTRGFSGRIVMVGDEPDGPYERPMLSKEVLGGHRTLEETLLRPVGGWQDDDIELVTATRVERLLPAERGVLLSDGRRLRADKLLLATGVRPRLLRVPGADLGGVHYLRTMADSAAVRAQLRPGEPIVVIGAGFIGAEVAACAQEARCTVTVLELAPVPMARVLGDQLGAAYARYHRDRGVDLRTGIGVERIEGDRRVRAVVASDGSRIEASCVVVGVGVEPVDELARDAGIDTDDGVLTDTYCQTSIPEVFAAGDVARTPNPYFGGLARLEHFQNAQNQGLAAAGSMLGERIEFAEVPWLWSDQYDLNLQVAGDPTRGEQTVVRGDPDEEQFCAFYLRDGVVVGAVAVNRPRELRATMTLIKRGVPVEAAQLCDDSVDLRRLGRVAV